MTWKMLFAIHMEKDSLFKTPKISKFVRIFLYLLNMCKK